MAVEVISPQNTPREITLKISHYLDAGTVVWVVYPQEREVHIHTRGQLAQVVDEDGTLTGGDVLPGFQIAVKDIFPKKRDQLEP